MFPSWRMQLGEARRALKEGQLDRACAIVQREELREFRQARELSAELAGRVAQRARGRLAAGRSNAGWNDLELAEHVAGCDLPVAQVRNEYRQAVFARAVDFLADGRTAVAQQELAKLARRGLRDAQVRQLEEFARSMSEAEQMLSVGSSAEARQALEKIAVEELAIEKSPENLSRDSVKIDWSRLAQRVEWLLAQCQRHSQLRGELHAAANQSDWHQMLARADKLLSVAPRDRVARAARRQAWHAVGLDATAVFHREGRPLASLALNDTKRGAQGSASKTQADDTMSGSQEPNRFMLWVDAVGGFLVCLDDEVVLGQPTPGSAVAVPLCADLSRRHAVIRRHQGGYTLDPLGEVKVDGRLLTGPMVLGNRHEIELGSAVRLEFTRPHALSATARLTPLSGHRTEPRADAVLLMADSCLLGPKSHSHIACRRWQGDVMLFRQAGRLHCRSTMEMTVDGSQADGPTPLESGARLEGEEFAISLEDV
ncbi:FHA domain-containing protein [Aeoliella sp. ICT_H6.2]|uniref:FHA domain-containing protein n=1 Tax=Aeoliella straminimaris TaxID=2954799 RepID=A0A9X2JH07_9BACT|nr:FHA domain-containing protein [Aeoliella straminimaris]MCO6044967.1 FHA domain-containing protein [Aeoliella straminimaris]